MWYILRSFAGSPEVADSAGELLLSTSRRLILVVVGAFLFHYLFFVWTWPGIYDVRFLPSLLALIGFSAVAYWLLPERFLTAQAIWLLGLLGTVALTLRVSQIASTSLLAILLTPVAVVTISWHAGVVMQLLATCMLIILTHTAGMPRIPAEYIVNITFAGSLAGAMGWAAIGSLATVTGWSLYSFEQAQSSLEAAREQRVALLQMQEDLTLANRELARLTDQLRVMYEAAERARQVKEEFVANVSHELRTPLNMIIGFSDMIIQSPEMYGVRLPPKLLADIGIIRRNSQQLARLVDDVLDLSQIDADRMALSREMAALDEIIESAVESVRGFFAKKGLYLDVKIEPDLPQVWCDRVRIRQIIINLLSNAGRFTQQGGVCVRAHRDGNRTVISVADTGPGISEDDQRRLFEPFQQLDSSIRRRHGGSGLGLYISKRFVEMHGGDMWLESTVGVGTTIYFSLPLRPSSPDVPAGDVGITRWFSDHMQGYVPRVRPGRAPHPDVRPRFVVVDPVGTVHRLFGRYMGDAEVVMASDLEQGVNQVQQAPTLALIVNAFDDVPIGSLPPLPYGTPVITTWVPGDREAVAKLGVAAYLVKPVARDTLLTELGRFGDTIKTVLLVDDEPDVLQLFTRFLLSSERGYRVIPTSDGAQALALMRERQPDIVLLDLIMPGMDGFALLHAKNADPVLRDIPIIVISSQDAAKDPLVARRLAIARSEGLSARDLLSCIRAITDVLVPLQQPNGPARPRTPAA